MACNVFSFVDDERVTGPDKELAWQASHVLTSKQSYLGIQDAGQKENPCSKQPGAWAGAIVHVLGSVCSHFSREVDKVEDDLEKVVGSTDSKERRGPGEAISQGAVV